MQSGIALLLNVGISLDMSVITIDADGTLQINTTGSSGDQWSKY